MNTKRYVIASIALFIFIYVYESFVHGVLLMGLYNETPNLWRNYSEMMSFLPFNITLMAILALWITFIFTRFFQDGGWKNGLHFGFYIGILSGLQAVGAYFYLPISITVAVSWFFASLVESLIGSTLIGGIYRR